MAAHGPITTDPGLEASSDGRPLLQSRLGLYGKALMLINFGYWPAFLLIWSREPAVAGFEAAWRRVVAPGPIVLNVLYAILWIVGAGKPRGPGFLVALDVAANTFIGLDLVVIMHSHPSQPTGVFEALLALVCILAVRALVVPSQTGRSLAVGLLMSASTVVAVAVSGDRLAGGRMSTATLTALVANWCAVAVAFSTVASAVLYGLRRQVRDARRLGQYTLLGKLGEGGMGVVYRASHAMLRRPTAIKLLSRGGAGTLERFEQEVQALAGLNHPNTVTIHDYGRTADGTFYYAMEYLDGLDLENVVAFDGPQPAARVIHILRQAASALAGAHDIGLIHRDVKPANIFLCRRFGEADAVKVLDFGLAKDLAATTRIDLTGASTILGTPLYISPEALTGDPPPDGRSDLYSLGAVAYNLLTGRPVFEGRTPMEVCAHHLQTPPVPPSQRNGRSVPSDLEAVVLRCLSKDPAQRYASAVDLALALGRCADASGWTAADAEAWWIERRERIEKWRDQRAAAGTESTLLVDAGGRRPD